MSRQGLCLRQTGCAGMNWPGQGVGGGLEREVIWATDLGEPLPPNLGCRGRASRQSGSWKAC